LSHLMCNIQYFTHGIVPPKLSQLLKALESVYL
jgi:hypothetical protein